MSSFLYSPLEEIPQIPITSSKVCLITTGATAPFPALIKAILSLSVARELVNNGYTHLIIQYGDSVGQTVFEAESAQLHARLDAELKDGSAGLVIDGFGFKKGGLTAEYVLVRETRGLIVSHAGSGSILEAMRIDVPMIVVPNPDLLDNHQEDLADELARQKYLIKGRINSLETAIREAEVFKKLRDDKVPLTSGKHRRVETSTRHVLDEALNWQD